MTKKKKKNIKVFSVKTMAPTSIMISSLIFCFSCLAIAPAKCSSNETDLLSLLAFKAAIDVDPLGALNSWNETIHFCEWKGIECGHKNRDRVVSINLQSEGLAGSLSPHIGNLSFLRSIVLKNNSFHGQIPQETGRLRRLGFVELSNNSFNGEIPRNLSQCKNLVYLVLAYNVLVGTVPSELGSLNKLQFLNLAINHLSGYIPPSIGNLTSLTAFSFFLCGLKGEIPESIAQLQHLTFIQLGENNFTGRIPTGLFNISSIVTFGFGTNKLQGVIPSNVGLTLPNLQGLYLGNNQFSGTLPVSLSNATSLERISLYWNDFIGPVPKEIGRLSNLQTFLISVNHIQDDINFISSLTNCTSLQLLEAAENLLSGSLPESIGNLSSTQLRGLVIFSNQLHGNIPQGIGNLISLTSLLLSDNYLEGHIPLTIGKLKNLHEIDLGANKFMNEIPSSFGNLTMLNHVSLKGNNISGNIPPNLSNCTNLLDLDFSFNHIGGLIPKEIAAFSSISITFDLSYNALEGSIPYEVGSFTNLANLDLSNNWLSGLIPNSISNCMSLQRLHLEGNSFQGEIPEGLSSLMGLEDLDLSRNNLSGIIPSFLGVLHLKKLNLSFNKLEGEVPKLGVFSNGSAISLDGNKELCGGILELKLPLCSLTNSSNKILSSSNKILSSTLLKILIPTSVIAGVIFIMLWVFVYWRKIFKNCTSSSSSVPLFSGPLCLRLSYADLLRATDGFSDANLIGNGRFGSVYKGILNDGQTQVAVKVLKLFVKGASKSLMAECNALKGIRHRNLLKILSVCQSTDFQGNEFKALVYEFKENGSLENWLHPNEGQGGGQVKDTRSLNIHHSLKIAIDVANGLNYLHSGTGSTIVHGDLKPSNILLDRDMNAHIGDFGLAKFVSSLCSSHEISSSIGIRGTIGYIAPEYGTNNLVSTKGDIYSYGILLLEMFTKRRPIDVANEGHESLHNLVSRALPSRVMEIVDPDIRLGLDRNNSKTEDCICSILSIGVACSRETPKDRMLMTEVVNELEKIRTSYLAEEMSSRGN